MMILDSGLGILFGPPCIYIVKSYDRTRNKKRLGFKVTCRYISSIT